MCGSALCPSLNHAPSRLAPPPAPPPRAAPRLRARSPASSRCAPPPRPQPRLPALCSASSPSAPPPRPQPHLLALSPSSRHWLGLWEEPVPSLSQRLCGGRARVRTGGAGSGGLCEGLLGLRARHSFLVGWRERDSDLAAQVGLGHAVWPQAAWSTSLVPVSSVKCPGRPRSAAVRPTGGSGSFLAVVSCVQLSSHQKKESEAQGLASKSGRKGGCGPVGWGWTESSAHRILLKYKSVQS